MQGAHHTQYKLAQSARVIEIASIAQALGGAIACRDLTPPWLAIGWFILASIGLTPPELHDFHCLTDESSV